jgi:hypothetical protein
MKHSSLLLIFFVILLSQCQIGKNNQVQIDLNHVPEKVELFGEGIISTHLYERDIAIAPEGNEIIFTINDFRQINRCLVSIRKTDDIWSRRKILSFSGRHHDIEPFFSVDGQKLYFASNRPIFGDSTRSDYNIWVTERAGSDWTEPVALPACINTSKDEFYPAVSKNQNLYFTATRENGIGTEDIFLSRFSDGKYLDPEPLDTAINSKTYEFNAYVSPDETMIIFSSYGREDDMGGGDLYFSKKDDLGDWVPAENMGTKVNSTGLDFCPFIDFPRENFYFTSDRYKASPNELQKVEEIEEFAGSVLNGMGNFFRIGLEEVGF